MDYEQFGIDDYGKILYWIPGDKTIPMTATRGKYDFLALSSGGIDAVRRSLRLTGYTSNTSRLNSAAERALRQADKVAALKSNSRTSLT